MPEQEQDLQPGPVRIVGIGASAGGLKAISALLGALPSDLDMAFVVVMHLDPTHPSSLAQLLGAACSLPVHQAKDRMELEPGHVYVIPPNESLKVEGRSLRLTRRTRSRRPQQLIDVFLRSVAEEHDGRGVGILLSGTGSDGTAGLRAIQAVGGITFAQDHSAEHGDMPASAVAAGCVDAVLPPAGIARELVRICRHPSEWLYREPPVATAPSDEADRTELALDDLVRRLSRVTDIDFLHYKQTTIRRRIQRRILLLGLDRVEDYVAHFDEHPEEAETLCRDILIHVTSFFRDPEVFEALGDTVFPAMVENRARGEPIRIWMPGCATGEEVYSLAICLLEFLDQRELGFPIKIFGTDVSEQAIARARTGRYPERITEEIAPERLRKYFAREEDGYVVTKAVRDLCVFAQQDATRDPPFSNLDLVSCRNLLIYLGPTLQNRVVPVFHYALREGGHLLLGSAESVGRMEDLFAVVDKRHSLYVRRSVPRRLPLALTGREHAQGGRAGGPDARAVDGFDLQHEADRIALSKYAPAGVLVDGALEVLQFRGDTSPFLAQAPGPPSNNLLRMTREGLLPDLLVMIEEGKERGAPVRREGLRIKADAREIHANLELIPIRIPGTAECCHLILFEEAPEPAEAPAPSASGPAPPGAELVPSRVEQLERELVATRDFLRSNVERVEAANEELRAANEEILSSNEELQSTNEELQTAKEELQATNEELITTNEELRHRNSEVAQLSDDLTNLLASVKLPIVMLGRDLRIRRFTPAAARLFGITPSHIGQSLVDLALALTGSDLATLLPGVLDTLVSAEQEVQDRDGRWYSLRAQPYRTQDDKVDGVVMTLSDIDSLKRFADELERARGFAEAVVMSVREPLLVLDRDLSVRMVNQSFCDTFATTPQAVQGLPLGEGHTTSWTTPRLLELLTRVAAEGTPFSDLAAVAAAPGRRTRRLRLNARPVPGDDGRERLVLLAVEDVTDQELELAEKERLSRKLQETQRLESLGVLAGGIAHDFNNILTAILGFAELIQTELPPDSKVRSYNEAVVQNARRAAELCNEMLAYSGRGRFQVSTVDLSTLVRDSASLLEAMVNKGACLHYDLAAELPTVEVDVAQIRQVLANLVINASEALSGTGGAISVTTGVVEADPAYLEDACVGDVCAGEYVYLEVADDGPGMSSETQSHIFDPFFTTKFTGRGLGLAAVLGIVRGHRGALKLESELGSGSTFRFLLPSKTPHRSEALQPSVREGRPWKGQGTVLVVDDEANVRSLLTELLSRLGLRVEEARNGEEGTEMLRAGTDRFDLVLLDLTMPGLSGTDVYWEMRKLRRDLPVVLMSGYDEDQVLRGITLTGLAGFLRKPFAYKDLVAICRDTLSPSPAVDTVDSPDPER